MIRDERGGGDPKNVQFANCGFDPTLTGKTLADATRQARPGRRRSSNAAETTIWIVEQGGCQGIFHAMSEEDLVRILRHPATMIASDGEVPVVRPRQSASAQLRHVRARARRLRAREAGADARGRGAEDDVVSGGARSA